MADGTEAQITAEILVECRVQNFTDSVTFSLIENLTSDAILGMDLLMRWNAIVNIPQKKVFFKYGNSVQDEQATTKKELCSLQDIQPAQKVILKQFLEKELPMFDLVQGPTKNVSHRIRLKEDTPIKQRYRPLNPAMQQVVNRELDKMLAEGVVEPSNSPWSSPIVIVPKKNNEYRFCVDYRKVNSVSLKDSYPLPYINAILDKLRKAKFISTLDLKSGYWQVPLIPDSKPITAFTVPNRGLFQFNVMPFGLHSAPATFQRLLDSIIGPELEPCAFAYLDDIIVLGSSFDEHLQNLKMVFQKLRQANLRINPDKCKFGRSELKYLGHVVSKNGIGTDPEKVRAIEEFSAPKTLKQLRRFLGMASWYRRFIPDFSTITAPLTKLLRKKQAWNWSDQQEEAFQKLKQTLGSAPILTCPDFQKTFFLQTDSSNFGLGAALFQKEGEKEKVIAYASRSLNAAEKNYSTTEKECLAVVWAIQKMRHYLEGYHFKVITDHQALKWLHSLKNPTGRLARWAINLQQYDFEIIYRKGSLNQVADALSRQPSQEAPCEELLAIETPIQCQWYRNKYRQVQNNPDEQPDFTIREDKLYKRIMDTSDLKEHTRDWKLCVPTEARERLLQENHDNATAGHLGVAKTISRIAANYYWPGMFRDINRYVKTCLNCQKYKSSQQKTAGQMYASDIPFPWHTVSTDLIGPFPRSTKGNNYLLVFQDRFTKWVECVPLRKAVTKHICQAFKERVLCRFGCPKKIITDNGPQYDSTEFRRMLQDFRIQKIEIAPYSPQNNPVERANKVLKTMISQMCNNDHRKWDVLIPEISLAMNSAKHQSTGFTPAFLNFGRELDLPTNIPELQENQTEEIPTNTRLHNLQEAVRIAKINLGRAYTAQQHYYNLRRRDWKPEVDDLVYVREHPLSSAVKGFAAKLAPKYEGPHRVARMFSPVLFEIIDSRGRKSRVHVKDLKPAHIRS